MRTYKLLTQAQFAKAGQPPAEVTLPHTWNALDGQDGGNDYYRGVGVYEIALPDPTPGKRQYIEIQGANHVATVWCNGVKLGTHKGGFSTFRYELTKAMTAANNVLKVSVTNEVCQVYPQRADFTFFGGLYRDVVYIEAEDAHFDLLKNGSDAVFATAYSNGRVRFDLFPVNSDGLTVEVEILDADENVVAKETAEAQAHTSLYAVVPEPHLWHGVEDPYCYTTQASLKKDGQLVDQVVIRFGFRSFRVDAETGFYLNGKSVPLRGVCRHQDRKDKGWAISWEDHREDMDLICEVGANTIRLAHYQHDQKFYDLCDDEGMVVWAEIPFISQFLPSQQAYDNTISQMTELIAQNYNHPSICFWGISNEITIGGFSEELFKNLQDLNALCKRLDPSRLTTMAQIASVPYDSEHNYITDVLSYNLYYGWYARTLEDNPIAFDGFHKMNPDRPYGLSEYGVDNLVKWHSATPINHDYTEEYSVKYHHALLRYIMCRPFIWGTHVWNMFDFAVDGRDEGGIKGLNSKGLVSHDRKLKKDAFFVYQAYWTKEPMVHICGRRFTDRAPGERDVTIFTNCETVTLYVGDREVGTQKAVDHCVVFADVPLADGANTLTAKAGTVSDTVTLNAVIEHNTQYDLPDLVEAMNVGNWFESLDEDETLQDEGGYDLTVPVGELLDNEMCMKVVKGWIMASRIEQKLATVSRLTNWKVMWGDRCLPQLPVISKNMTQDDYKKLEKMLRRIKRT